jgi:hypothetical protein
MASRFLFKTPEFFMEISQWNSFAQELIYVNKNGCKMKTFTEKRKIKRICHHWDYATKKKLNIFQSKEKWNHYGSQIFRNEETGNGGKKKKIDYFISYLFIVHTTVKSSIAKQKYVNP